MKTTPVHVTRSTMGKLIVKPDFSVVAITSMPIASIEREEAGSAGLDCHTFLTEPAATPDQAGGKTEAFFEGLFFRQIDQLMELPCRCENLSRREVCRCALKGCGHLDENGLGEKREGNPESVH